VLPSPMAFKMAKLRCRMDADSFRNSTGYAIFLG